MYKKRQTILAGSLKNLRNIQKTNENLVTVDRAKTSCNKVKPKM